MAWKYSARPSFCASNRCCRSCRRSLTSASTRTSGTSSSATSPASASIVFWRSAIWVWISFTRPIRSVDVGPELGHGLELRALGGPLVGRLGQLLDLDLLDQHPERRSAARGRPGSARRRRGWRRPWRRAARRRARATTVPAADLVEVVVDADHLGTRRRRCRAGRWSPGRRRWPAARPPRARRRSRADGRAGARPPRR